MHVYTGYIFIFIAAICWGFLGVFGRIAMDAGLAPMDVAFYRAALGGVFMLIHSAAVRDIHIREKKDAFVFVLFGLISIATFFVAYQYAVKEGGAALASVLLYTAPAWVAVFSRIFFGLKFTLVTTGGVCLALLGVMLISFSSTPNATHSDTLSLLGIFFGLLSGFLYATHFIVTKKYLTIYTPFTLYGYSSLVAAVCILPFAQVRLYMPWSTWLAILAIGFVCTYIAYWAYCEGIRRLNPTKAAVLATLEPVVATIAAWTIWRESFTGFGWLGAILVIATVIILLFDDKKRVQSRAL